MKNRLSSQFLFVMMILLSPRAIAIHSCGGPVPYKDISHIKFPKFFWLQQNARNFSFWENSSQIIIRNYRDELRRYSLRSGFLTSLSKMDRPMTTSIDETNRYVATAGENSVFDVDGKRWHHFIGPKYPVHLFWRKGLLYTVDFDISNVSGSTFTIYRYQPGKKRADYRCSLSWPSAKNLDMAHGQQYPFLTLFTKKITAKGNEQLQLHQLDVRDCNMSFTSPSALFEEKIQRVYAFAGLGSYGVMTDGAHANFHWRRPGHDCDCLKLDTFDYPMILDKKNVTLATWNTNDGLKIYDLQKRTFFSLLKNWDIAHLGEHDVQMSSQKNNLVLAPRMNGNSTRQLLHIEIEERP